MLGIEVPRGWLRRKSTVEDFERAEMERIALVHGLPIDRVVEKFGMRPFLSLTDAWRTFTAKKGEEDELWSFSTHEGVPSKMHWRGFAIVRDGKICETFVTLMS